MKPKLMNEEVPTAESLGKILINPSHGNGNIV